MNLDQMNAVQNLIAMGFTPRDADFLYLAGTHSGVFTLRQYRTFVRAQRGGFQDRFTARLEANKFITRLAISTYNQIIHLSSKTFYRAILTEDSRLRRGMSAGLMRQRLQFMDFIVLNPEARYLTTESAKCDIITAQFGVTRDVLPRQTYCSRSGEATTVRYFPERFPLFIKETPMDVLLGVVYGEDPAHSFAAFRKFITDNRPLFDAVPSLSFVYISPFERRRAMALDYLAASFEHTHAVSTPAVQRYFSLRKRFDNKLDHTFTDDDVEFWDTAHRRYNKPQYEPLYAEYCGQMSLSAVSCASPRRTFECVAYTPLTSLDGTPEAEQ